MTPGTINESVCKVVFVDERYELGELLGAGSMGQIFAARDVVLGIDVALKMLHPALVKSRMHVAMFTTEAAVSTRMLSPHVVKVMGLAVTREGTPCIIYERLEGETLGQRIARDGSLSLSETAEIVKQTSRALARAHAIRVLHRDVKPDNIFLTKDSRGRMLVKLLDFGIAVTQEGDTFRPMPAGTPEYMAPEALLGRGEIDMRIDLYALGVVTYECVTGRCPFQGSLEEIMRQLRAGVSPMLTDHRPDLHGAIDTWMVSALHHDPYWRFASAKELSDSLEAAIRSAESPNARLDVAA